VLHRALRCRCYRLGEVRPSDDPGISRAAQPKGMCPSSR
jgi:hypothetical protein